MFMKYVKKILTSLGLIAALVVLTLPPVAAAGYMYRYLNDAGNVVMGYSIPPEFIHNG